MDEKAHSNLGDELRELRQKARDMYPSAERLPTEVSVVHALALWEAAQLQGESADETAVLSPREVLRNA
jgi:hypothetical protein